MRKHHVDSPLLPTLAAHVQCKLVCSSLDPLHILEGTEHHLNTGRSHATELDAHITYHGVRNDCFYGGFLVELGLC